MLASGLLASLFGATEARAEEARADKSVSVSDLDKGGSKDESGAFLVAGKIGGIASFNGLSPFVIGGVELGYAFARRTMAVMLDASYTAPSSDGQAKETFNPARIPDGTYKWELHQKELVFQPTFLYRLTSLSDRITPYAGLGPRIYLLQSVTRGSSGGKTFQDSTEQSTKFGFGIPLGAELKLGPGGIFAEFLFQWAPLDHQTTGDTNLGSGSLFLGYRALI